MIAIIIVLYILGGYGMWFCIDRQAQEKFWLLPRCRLGYQVIFAWVFIILLYVIACLNPKWQKGFWPSEFNRTDS